MLLRSGRTKNKILSDRQVEPEQKNFYFEGARGLPNPEINHVSLPIGRSITQNSTGAIPKITKPLYRTWQRIYKKKYRVHTERRQDYKRE